MLTSLVYLQQGNLKKTKNLMKIVFTGEKKSLYFLNELSSFNETFKKGVPYDDIKSHKKQDCTHTLKNMVLEKPGF